MDRRDATRRITYSAVCTAIAVTVILISHFSPMRIVPLILASLAFYIAFVRCGALYVFAFSCRESTLPFFFCV